MSLSNALATSVSGLDTSSTAISVIGDNIANANTPGFKEKRAEFSAVLGQSISSGAGFSQVGAGVRTNNIGTIFSQGTFESTARNTDLGIEGRGFFILEGNAGRTYSRAGVFGFDDTGLLVDAVGSRVQGFTIDQTTGVLGTTLSDVVVTGGLAPPQPTTSIALEMNLNSQAQVPAAFDVTDTGNTSNAQESVTIYDSLGQERTATIFFRKNGANDWQYFVTLPQADSSVATTDPYVIQGSGTLAFDPGGSGALVAIDGGTTDPTINFNFDTSNGAAATQAITFSMGGLGPLATGSVSTQFDAATATNFKTQDGFGPGTLSFLDIDQDGQLNGVFSNGATIPLARLALANFGNVEALTDIGGSQLVQSAGSGAPVIAAANTGSLGSIRSSSLENSNVDLADQFVKLIVSQRAFQANTRTVSVANELLANLVSLGQ